MGTDLSTRKSNGAPLRAADALLRSLGGCSVCVRLPLAPGDGSDAAQIGLGTASIQDFPLSPSLFRRVRVLMQEGQPSKYEVLVSASAVAAVTAELTLTSADRLFQMAMGLVIGKKLFLIEAITAPELFGQVYLYRLLVREAEAQGQ
jgi:hypothetical protein